MKSWLPVIGLLLVAGGGSSPRLSDFIVTRQGNELLVSFQLLDAFDEPTLERIESGLPTTFIYILKLERVRKWWFNRTVARSQLDVVTMYNALTREYLVNTKQDGRLIDSRVVKDPQELERAMTSFHALSVFELEDVPGRLVARVRVELGSKTILGIIPTTKHTDWVESERFRARGVGLEPMVEETSGTP